jgi:hypothetical protein
MCTLTAIATAAAAAAEPPKADVRFVIEAQQFVDGLQSSRAGVERALTQTLLDECRGQKSFPFVRWVNGDTTAVNRLVVAVVQRRAGGDFETLIEYRGTTAAGALPPDLQKVVYRWFDPKNAETPEIVKAHLRDAIHKEFEGEKFRSDLLRYFISRVPLAESVNLDARGHRVLVPLAAAALQADERQSELAVSFFGKSDGRPGRMMLREPLDYPQHGVLCAIKEFDFVLPPLAGWSDRIPEVFATSKVRDVRVTMSTYVPKWFPGTRDGSLTND